jgi:PadR family transcriptional regulator PadR
VVHVEWGSDQSLGDKEGSLDRSLHRMEQSRGIGSGWALRRDQLAREGFRLSAARRIQLLEAETNFEHSVKGVRAHLRYA